MNGCLGSVAELGDTLFKAEDHVVLLSLGKQMFVTKEDGQELACEQVHVGRFPGRVCGPVVHPVLQRVLQHSLHHCEQELTDLRRRVGEHGLR